MSNHLPKPKRKTFTEIINSNPHAAKVLKRNRIGLERFIRNNAKFLSEANKSVYRQCKDISKESDLIISPQMLHGIKVGNKKVCSTYIVYLIGEYWGIDGAEMLVKEFDKLPDVA